MTFSRDYQDFVIQFGWILMFSGIFPFAALVSLVNNAIEVHLDAKRAFLGERRPIPRSVLESKSPVFAWENCLFIEATIAIPIVGLLQSFSSGQFEAWTQFFVKESTTSGILCPLPPDPFNGTKDIM